MISKSSINGVEIVTIESNKLIVSIAPALGGKITSLYNKNLRKEFLWTAEQTFLKPHTRGADYDSNFFGGIDELLPNDIPETIDAIAYPDHGELWTTALQYHVSDEKISVHGKLESCGLYYSKTIYADTNSPVLYLDYTIKNEANRARHFLWKLHAALRIQAGDKLVTGAAYGQVVDPEYSRFKELTPFLWPVVEGTDASIIPARNNTMDFFYLYEIPGGEMQLVSSDGKNVFRYSYDPSVFPYQWYFASYGGFLNHYTAILEPCTNMPISVNDAIAKGQCAVLQPGEILKTTVRIYAGETNNETP